VRQSFFRWRKMLMARGYNEDQGTMRSGIVLFVFFLIVLCQLSMLKFVLGIEGIASIVNSLMLLGFSILGLRNIVMGVFARNVWGAYLFPGILVFGGFLLNISLNLIDNPHVANYLGLIIPWAAFLAVPFFIRDLVETEKIWRFFYRFMLFVSIIGLLEYVLIFNNILSLRVLNTPYGNFLTGGISVFLMPADGLPHHRMHSIFPEPGTYAMYLLAAIMYALVNKKYFGLLVFAIAFFLTDSLGGYISLILLMLLFVFIKVRRTRFSLGVTMIPVFILAIGLVGYVAPYLSETYSNKGESAEVREGNFADVIEKLPSLMLDEPMGMTLAEESISNSAHNKYLGSNFAPGTAYTMGGDFAFLGYSAVIITCLWVSFVSLRNGSADFDQQIVFPVLLIAFPFVFQRLTIMDSATFAFLFAPSIIRYLRRKRSVTRSTSALVNLE
jgi:hypothetical protein